jgi:hypothetical protein
MDEEEPNEMTKNDQVEREQKHEDGDQLTSKVLSWLAGTEQNRLKMERLQ